TTPGSTTPGVTTPGSTTPGPTTPGVTTPGSTTPAAGGYWELQGDPVRKSGATDAWADQNGWLGKIYSFDNTHVCYGYRHPTVKEFSEWSKARLDWDPLPGILVPGQGIAARAKVEGSNHSLPVGGVYISGFGHDILRQNGRGESRSSLKDTTVGKGTKAGETNTITVTAGFSAMGASHVLQYTYVWKEGKPPATPGLTTPGPATPGPTTPGPTTPGPTTPGPTTPGPTTPGPTTPGPTTPPGPGPEPAAVSQMTLQAGVRKVPAGQTVTVPVWLINAAAANMNFNVHYDRSVATPASPAIKGNLLDKAMFEANTGEAGIVRVGLAQGKDLSGTGTVTQIPFKAVGQPGDKTALRLEVIKAANAQAANAPVGVIHGEILIVGPDGEVPGDDNGDGVLSAGDALSALKMSVKLIPSKTCMDMDKDGQVTSNDAMLILQKVVGK
ncbi:MAG TPA: dockerin type I repeat-containing protein, partial [Phycisphaerae bacterium]|nr:dockerin type I repeat-containing protein [Phycisphaerae bacterium]